MSHVKFLTVIPSQKVTWKTWMSYQRIPWQCTGRWMSGKYILFSCVNQIFLLSLLILYQAYRLLSCRHYHRRIYAHMLLTIYWNINRLSYPLVLRKYLYTTKEWVAFLEAMLLSSKICCPMKNSSLTHVFVILYLKKIIQDLLIVIIVVWQ